MHFSTFLWLISGFHVLTCPFKFPDGKEVKLKLACKDSPNCIRPVIEFLTGGEDVLPSIKLDSVNSTKPKLRGGVGCQNMFKTLKPFKKHEMVVLQNCSGKFQGFVMIANKSFHFLPGTKPNTAKVVEIKPSNRSFQADVYRFDEEVVTASRKRKSNATRFMPRTASSKPYEIEVLALIDRKVTAGTVEDAASQEIFSKNIKTIFIETDAKYKGTGFRITLKKVVYLDWNHTLTRGLMNETYNDWYEMTDDQDPNSWFKEYPDWPNHDMIVMFTHRQPEDTGTYGISAINTVCSDLALSLVQMYSANPTNILIHEIAHVLNAYHDDGRETPCLDRRSFMYPEYHSIDWSNAIWSKCSKKAFKGVQDDEKRSFCLHMKME